MDIGKKIGIFLVGMITTGILVACFFPKEEPHNDDAQIRIGAGDDISGLLMDEIADHLGESYGGKLQVEDDCFMDCCSNTAQWAITAGKINVGFFCSHMAKHLIEENDNVSIYGPVIMNAEVICYKENWENVRRIGITQGRVNEKEWASRTYPQIEVFDEITQKGIMYSLERGQIDGVIQDLSKAALYPQYQFMPISDTDYISYVLVVDNSLLGTEEFDTFVDTYNDTVERFKDDTYLAGLLGVSADWLADKKIEFLPLVNY